MSNRNHYLDNLHIEDIPLWYWFAWEAFKLYLKYRKINLLSLYLNKFSIAWICFFIGRIWCLFHRKHQWKSYICGDFTKYDRNDLLFRYPIVVNLLFMTISILWQCNYWFVRMLWDALWQSCESPVLSSHVDQMIQSLWTCKSVIHLKTCLT